MNRRNIIAAMPFAIFGLTAAAKGHLAPILSARELNYALEIMTEASTTGISCSFVAFAQHVSTLAKAGDCEGIRAVAESLLDRLYQEDNYYNESRERWLAEECDYFAEVVDMDDATLSGADRDLAFKKSNERHARRSGEGGAA